MPQIPQKREMVGMVGEIDLYNYPRRLELSLRKMNEDSLVCDEDKKSITSFSKVRLAKGSSHGRVAKVVYCLQFIRKLKM